MLAVTLSMFCLFVCVAGAKAAGKQSKPSPGVDRALRHAARTYGVPYREMLAVSFCESRWNPNAIGNGSHGLFQFLRSTWAHTPFAGRNIYSAWWNAHAAAWLWRHDGGSWREWTCRP